jgi:hypothetical protein
LFFHKQAAITLAEAFKMQTTRYDMLFHLWECCPYLVSLVTMMQDSSSFEWVGQGGGGMNPGEGRTPWLRFALTNACWSFSLSRRSLK